jgi:bifunctional DNA-binding transcriptional regulator/antitoxin component of YhaV-PrlF toxin-antitoxin module
MGRRKRTPHPRLVDNRNRVALTQEVIRALDLSPGDYVTFIVDEQGGVHLHKLDITVTPSKW